MKGLCFTINKLKNVLLVGGLLPGLASILLICIKNFKSGKCLYNTVINCHIS